MAEFYPDEDADPWVSTGRPAAPDTAGDARRRPVFREPSDADAVDRLAEKPMLPRFRGEGDEGFYPLPVALAIAAQADALGLAVVSLEGFTLTDGEPVPVSGLRNEIGDAHQGEAWPTFRAACNIQARALLERWVSRTGLVVAMEVATATASDTCCRAHSSETADGRRRRQTADGQNRTGPSPQVPS
jgi:hypothetical protein